MPVNLQRLLADFEAVNDSPYKLGAKWPVEADIRDVLAKPVDCSGFVRWLFWRQGIRLPDGSQQQWAYVRDVLKWRDVRYSDLHWTVEDPGRLFIAFKRATKSGHGHVWLVCGGQTLESYSGHGVGRRPWKRLERYAAACYEVPVTGR